MMPAANRPTLSNWWIPGLIIGVSALLYFSGRQLELTYDSVDYLKASESAQTYLTGVNPDGYPYMNRGILLHALLHPFEDKLTAALYLNVISYGVSLMLMTMIFRRLDVNPKWSYAGIIVAVLSYPWLQNHFFVWTEPLFSMLTLLFMYSLITDRSWVSIALLCVVMFLLRRAGAILFVSGILAYMFDGKWKKAAGVTVVMIVTFVSWLLLEFHFLQSSPSAFNMNYLLSLSRVHYIDVLTSWIVPRQIAFPVRILIAVFSVLVLLRFRSYYREIWNNKNIVAVTIVISCYILFFVVMFGAPDYHEAERFLSVILPFCIVLTVVILQKLSSHSPALARSVGILFILWLIYPLSRTISHFWSEF